MKFDTSFNQTYVLCFMAIGNFRLCMTAGISLSMDQVHLSYKHLPPCKKYISMFFRILNYALYLLLQWKILRDHVDEIDREMEST